METKNFLGLDGLNHFWEKAKIWIINEITTKIAGIVLSSVPTGTVLQGLYTTVPNGFLLCNGTAYLKTAYPKLFNVISTIYNLPTDSSDIFRVPDLRNRTVMGANPDVAGKADGNTSNVADVQKAQIPSFESSVFFWGGGGGSDIGIIYSTSGGAIYRDVNFISPSVDMNDARKTSSMIVINPSYNTKGLQGSTDHLGANAYANNGELRSANIRMNYIIKY